MNAAFNEGSKKKYKQRHQGRILQDNSMSTTTNNESNIRKVPSELQKDEKFEHCVETTLRKTTIGLLTSVIPAFLVRGNYSRVAVLAFGAGIGFGMGYTECRLLYEKNISFQKKYIATVQVNNEDQKSH